MTIDLRSGQRRQAQIDRHFDGSARHWKELYDDRSLEGVIHQGRRLRTMKWLDELALPSGARVLEVGCGAGLLASQLAKLGYAVECIDSSESMVALATEELQAAGVQRLVGVERGDVHALGFSQDSFDLVIALGVLPFLHDPEAALAEMSRVTRAGRWIVLSSDNRFRLNRLLDPRYFPFPGREALKRWLTALELRAPTEVPTNRFSYQAIERLLERAGFTAERCATLGFGPFTFFGKPFLGEPAAISLNNWLQDRADRTTPGVGVVGGQHLIRARKA